MTLFVTGRRTTIVAELAKLVPDETILRLGVDTIACTDEPLRYLFAAGILRSQIVWRVRQDEAAEAMRVNLLDVIQSCEQILDTYPQARICIIGSESARNGSFDRLYAACKAGIHAYVQQRPTKWQQQLVCVSPPIIADSGMTMRRHDYPEVLEHRAHVHAIDVARVVKRALYDRQPSDLTGCVLSVHPTITPEQPQDGQSQAPGTAG